MFILFQISKEGPHNASYVIQWRYIHFGKHVLCHIKTVYWGDQKNMSSLLMLYFLFLFSIFPSCLSSFNSFLLSFIFLPSCHAFFHSFFLFTCLQFWKSLFLLSFVSIILLSFLSFFLCCNFRISCTVSDKGSESVKDIKSIKIKLKWLER